jgi:hypothetical protein
LFHPALVYDDAPNLSLMHAQGVDIVTHDGAQPFKSLGREADGGELGADFLRRLLVR